MTKLDYIPTPLDFAQKYLNRLDIPCVYQEELFHRELNTAKLDGLFIELGYYIGGTATSLCNTKKDMILYSFDHWKGLESFVVPNSKKGDCSWCGELPKIHENVRLVIGNVQDTLETFLNHHNKPIAFANFDMDGNSDYFVFCKLAEMHRLKKGTVFNISHALKLYEGKSYTSIYDKFMEFVEKYNVKFKYFAFGDVHLALIIDEDV